MPRKSNEKRLSNYAVDDAGCWIWQGAKYTGGYGHVAPLMGEVAAHRASYVFHKGPISDGFVVMHSCDKRACINPNHLSLGTQSQNVADAYRKNRASMKGARNGNAKLTARQVEAIRKDSRFYHVIAADYQVCKSTIGEIKRGRLWISADANARSERKM